MTMYMLFMAELSNVFWFLFLSCIAFCFLDNKYFSFFLVLLEVIPNPITSLCQVSKNLL